MNPGVWSWDSSIEHPDPIDFGLLTWLATYGGKTMTVGGLAERLILFSRHPLLVYASNDYVLAVKAGPESVWSDFHAEDLLPASSFYARFEQGEKIDGRWEVSSPSCLVGRTIHFQGNLLPDFDVRYPVLLGNPPRYSFSSLVNTLAQTAAIKSRSWLVAMDQITGDVDFYRFNEVSASSLALASMQARNEPILAAFARPLL
jgi:hypothetical protein